MAYVRSNITVIRRRMFDPANIESLSLDVKGNNGVYFMICACYRSPSKCKPPVFLTSLATTLELMYHSRQEIVVIGDLKFDLFSDHSDIKKFKELCDQFQFTIQSKRLLELPNLQRPYSILFSPAILTIMQNVAHFTWALATMI